MNMHLYYPIVITFIYCFLMVFSHPKMPPIVVCLSGLLTLHIIYNHLDTLKWPIEYYGLFTYLISMVVFFYGLSAIKKYFVKKIT